MDFETKIVNVSDEENVQIPQMSSSLGRQIPMFGDDNTNVGIAPFTNCDNLSTRAYKLPGVQRKLNKKLKKKKRRLFIGSFVIANAIINFIRVVKEIEMKKMEMIKFITFQMLQSEENGKQMMIRGQL